MAFSDIIVNRDILPWSELAQRSNLQDTYFRTYTVLKRALEATRSQLEPEWEVDVWLLVRLLLIIAFPIRIVCIVGIFQLWNICSFLALMLKRFGDL